MTRIPVGYLGRHYQGFNGGRDAALLDIAQVHVLHQQCALGRGLFGGHATPERNDCSAAAGASAVLEFAIVRAAKSAIAPEKAAAAHQGRSRITRAVMTLASTVTKAMSVATTACNVAKSRRMTVAVGVGRLREAGITGSIGSVGDALDNALMGSAIGLFKTELIDRHPATWRDRLEVEIETAPWVAWFNHDRLHSSIGYVPPVEFEANYHATRTTVVLEPEAA